MDRAERPQSLAGDAVRSQIPSGPVSDPDPLPDVAGLTAASAPVTLPSTGDDGPDYRAVRTPCATAAR